MSLSTTSVLNKILNEAKQAKENKTDQAGMQRHVANVKLLCELLLDGEDTIEEADDHSITPAEMKAMLGSESRSPSSSSADRKTTIEHGDANGESLFDF